MTISVILGAQWGKFALPPSCAVHRARPISLGSHDTDNHLIGDEGVSHPSEPNEAQPRDINRTVCLEGQAG